VRVGLWSHENISNTRLRSFALCYINLRNNNHAHTDATHATHQTTLIATADVGVGARSQQQQHEVLS
jgi:hypothetical protein